MPDTLNLRIRRLSEAKDLNKTEFAQQVGVSDISVNYWESGEIKQVERVRLMAARGLQRVFLCSFCQMPIEAELPARCLACDKGFFKPLMLTPDYAEHFPRVVGTMGRQHSGQ